MRGIYEDYYKRFLERFKDLRRKKGVKANEMSIALGNHNGYVSKIERGHTQPSLDAFFYICEYFGVPPKYFLDEEVKHPLDYLEIVEMLKELDSEQLIHIKGILQAIVKK